MKNKIYKFNSNHKNLNKIFKHVIRYLLLLGSVIISSCKSPLNNEYIDSLSILTGHLYLSNTTKDGYKISWSSLDNISLTITQGKNQTIVELKPDLKNKTVYLKKQYVTDSNKTVIEDIPISIKKITYFENGEMNNKQTISIDNNIMTEISQIGKLEKTGNKFKILSIDTKNKVIKIKKTHIMAHHHEDNESEHHHDSQYHNKFEKHKEDEHHLDMEEWIDINSKEFEEEMNEESLSNLKSIIDPLKIYKAIMEKKQIFLKDCKPLIPVSENYQNIITEADILKNLKNYGIISSETNVETIDIEIREHLNTIKDSMIKQYKEVNPKKRLSSWDDIINFIQESTFTSNKIWIENLRNTTYTCKYNIQKNNNIYSFTYDIIDDSQF